MVGLIFSIEQSSALQCYQCNEIDNPGCGATLTIFTYKVTCPVGDYCVTFKNPYDGGKLLI